jgi:hypothetical protein
MLALLSSYVDHGYKFEKNRNVSVFRYSILHFMSLSLLLLVADCTPTFIFKVKVLPNKKGKL